MLIYNSRDLEEIFCFTEELFLVDECFKCQITIKFCDIKFRFSIMAPTLYPDLMFEDEARYTFCL